VRVEIIGYGADPEIEVLEAAPRCGDHCDACGECLKCCAEDPCFSGGTRDHSWVLYEGLHDARIAEVRAEAAGRAR
jgi:hypothetical protein